MKVLRSNSTESLGAGLHPPGHPWVTETTAAALQSQARVLSPSSKVGNSPGEGHHFFQLLLSSALPLQQPGSAKQQQLSIQLSVSIERGAASQQHARNSTSHGAAEPGAAQHLLSSAGPMGHLQHVCHHSVTNASLSHWEQLHAGLTPSRDPHQ